MKRLIKIWEFKLRNGEKIKVEDASFLEAKKEVEKINDSGILEYKQISPLNEGEILVTNIPLSYGVTLHSKDDNKLPLYRMANNCFTQIELEEEAIKNTGTTYKELIKEKYNIKNGQIVRK